MRSQHAKEKKMRIELDQQEQVNREEALEMENKVAETEAELHQQELRNIQLKGEIEKNKLAARRAELDENLKILIAENEGMYNYMKLDEFTRAEEQIRDTTAKLLNAKDQQRMLQQLKAVRDEANEAAERLQTNPRDEGAIATQIRARTKGYEIALSKMRQIDESRKDEQDEVNSLRQLKMKTKNELNKLKIKNAAYDSMKKDKHRTQYTEQNQPETLTNVSIALAGEAYKEEQQGKRLKKCKLKQDINDKTEANKYI